MKRYRLDKENINGKYIGSIHFDTLQEAERHIVICFEDKHYCYIPEWNRLEYQSNCWCKSENKKGVNYE